MIKKVLRFIFLCFFIPFAVSAQIETDPPMRQVIASGGGSDTMSWGSIDFTIGEAIITTVYAPDSSIHLTQGFQQPNDLFIVSENGIVNSPCMGANKGSIAFKVINATGFVTFIIKDSTGVTTPINSVAIDSIALFTDLGPGDYTYTATDDKKTKSGNFTIREEPVDCNELVVEYTGITPNGDGFNDTWIIDSITNFKTNTVYIFNRWGNLIWKAQDYNNTNVVWRGTNQSGAELPDATYFYIIEADGEFIRKGWVELTH